MDTEVRSPQKNQQLSLKIGQRSYLNRDENENKAGNGSIKLNTSKKEKKNRESGKKSYDKKKPGTAHSPSAASLMKKSKSRMDRDPHGSKTSIKIPLNHERSPNSDHNRTSSTDWKENLTLTSSRKKISEVLNNRIRPISSKTDKRKQAVKLPIEHELEVADQQAEDEVVKRDMLDAYYRKRLHDIEEKSIKLEKERVKQEKEDLKRMGSVPKNYERSKKLAELYRIRQKLIQDDLFLKRYYDRENSKFELKPNPEYSYKKMSYKQPPLFTMDPNESQSPEKHTLKSRTSKTKEVTSYNQKYNKSYKYIASDFHEIHMHNFYDGEKKYLENKESNGNIRKLIHMERSHTATDIHKENYPFGRQKSKKKTLIIKEDDSKVGQEEGEENGDSGLKKEPKIKITYDPDEGFIKTKIVQDGSPNINDLQDWDLFLQDQKPVSVKEKNQDKKWVKNDIRKSEKKTENGMNTKMSDGGEFFNLVKEDQEYEALSKIPTHRKEKDFLRPEEIKRNNKILMKKSKPIQNLKQ